MGVYQKKLLDNIYSSKENFEAVNELVEIFKNKDFTKEYINEKIGKHATTLLMKCNESVTGYPAMPYIPNRQNTEFLFIYYEGVLQIGFGAAKGNKIKSEKQKLYKNLLEERFEDKVSWCNLDWVHIDIPLQIEYFDGIDKYLEHYFGILTNVKDEFLKM